MHFLSNPKYKLNLPIDQMKRIYFILIILLGALASLTYLYFSKLNRDTHTTDLSLSTAAAGSGLIFNIQNQKSITDLLSGQSLLQRLLSTDKKKALQSLQSQFLADPAFNRFLNGQNIYLSFMAGAQKELDLLISTQSNEPLTPKVLKAMLRPKMLTLSDTASVLKITTKDSLIFYIQQKEHLLLLSTSFKAIKLALNAPETKNKQEFVDYIKSNLKLSKNSVASVYLNFNFRRELLQLVSPEKTGEDQPLFNPNQGFACLSYNYSKEKILFNGNTAFKEDNDYLNLFRDEKADKITIDAVLPDNTAWYTIYRIGDYPDWSTRLNKRFIEQGRKTEIEKALTAINTKYQLDLQQVFPKYFKDQLVTFQLSTGEKLAAINLRNGDKLKQLLLDISTDQNNDIQLLKEQNLLYYYFGDPFRSFKQPYYTIIDNYMVFANHAASLQEFLNKYSNDLQLTNTKAYFKAFDQLPNTSTFVFYLDRKNAVPIASRNLYPSANQFYQSKEHLGNFNAFVYQLSADHKNFQTNVLFFNDTEL